MPAAAYNNYYNTNNITFNEQTTFCMTCEQCDDAQWFARGQEWASRTVGSRRRRRRRTVGPMATTPHEGTDLILTIIL